MKICPTCGRAWVPLGDEPAECPACRHAIGMCALVGGEPNRPLFKAGVTLDAAGKRLGIALGHIADGKPRT